jgi:formate dehydrogenase alpha subunit
MVINTHSPRVIEHRKTIVELMLTSHPDSCMVCDKGNRCQLRQLGTDLGIGFVDLIRVPLSASIEEVNPFIERDLSKCILCAKCIRADQELVVEGAIDYYKRGFITKPATVNDLPLEGSECTFCGTCVAICPTGALMEKGRIYGGTTKTVVQTTCAFCGCGCSLSLEVKDNRIVRVTPVKEGSINCGTLCARGSYGLDFIHSPERLTKPMIKKDEGFEEASWEEALELVASELGRIKNEHGPDSLAVLSSSKGTNEENYLLQKLARCVLGTNNIDNGSRIYDGATRIGLGISIGSPGTTKRLSVLEQSDVIMLVGADPTAAAPIVGYTIKRAVKFNGAKLILINPRQSKLSFFADFDLHPKPGTELVLLNSLAKVIIDEGLIDTEFITRKTDKFEALSKTLQKYTLQYAEDITGVPGDTIEAAAQLYAKATQPAIVYGCGVTQYINGTDNVKALANLALLAGNFGNMGGGIYALQRNNNGQGACDMGTLPYFLPGYQLVSDAEKRKKFEEHWEVSLPENPGITTLETIQQAKEGKIKGLYIVGENPALSYPNSDMIEQALDSLDFLVVQDMFLTETAKLANVVLPSASFAEKEGSFTNFEGRLGRIKKAIEPVGESLPDWEIILRLSEKMGYPLSFSSPREIMEEVKKLAPLHEGYTEPEKASRTECIPQERKRPWDGQFLKGFVSFLPVEYNPQTEEKTKDYPFTLITGAILHHFGNGGRTSKSQRLMQFTPEAYVEIGRPDAERLTIVAGDKVKIASPTGEVTAKARIVDTLPYESVFIPISFPEAPVNKLFSIALDPKSKTPSFKTCSVRIERIDADE